MRQYRDWKRLLALMLALALAVMTPLQVSEVLAEEDEVIVEEPTAPEESETSTETVAESPTFEVLGISTLAGGDVPAAVRNDAETKQPVSQTSETDTENWPYKEDAGENAVWLHVVNGNFSGSYGGKEISTLPSVLVTLDEGRELPENVRDITVTRTNGEFVGWYTEAPTEKLQTPEGAGYSVWHTENTNGEKIEVGDVVPEGVNVLYAAFNDKETEAEDGDKLVEFYLDWNGINGQFGHCLTCTRSYNDGEVYFTPEDAVVQYLNFNDGVKSILDNTELNDEGKWKALQEIWADSEFNGYTFKGWSTEEKGLTDLIDQNTLITNGMTFYAQWEKGDESSEYFDRTDPVAGPLEAIRIVAGAGTDFLSGTLHASRHAEENSSFTLNLFYTPIGAEINEVIWKVAVSDSATPEAAFRPEKNAETAEVQAGTEDTVGAIKVKADGCSLTVTSMDKKEHVIVVSATAKGADGQVKKSLSDATLSFAHSWGEGKQEGTPTCTTGANVFYTCTSCGETKTTTIPALAHVYNKSNVGNNGSYTVTQTKKPTCTEEGENTYTYKCLRCGAEIEKPEVVKVPALGHDWSKTVEPVSCNKNEVIEVCTRDGCTARKTSLVPADNPSLHAWKETRTYHETCKSDYIYEQCEVCGKTRSYQKAADNPDRHSYAYESRMSIDCHQVAYTFKCVHCDATQVMLKKEENHIWGGWTTSTFWDKSTGMMKSERKRTCRRCSKSETEDLGSVGTGTAGEATVPAANSASAIQPVNDTGENAVAVAAAAQAAPSEAASEGKAGWQKSGKKKYYLDENGKKQTGWQTINGEKYYFGKNGVMKTGWQMIKGKKYYFGKDGVMRTGKQKIGKKTYKFSKNGVLK